MKSTPPVQDFFKQLQHDLASSNYSERLQHELKDHIEDATYEYQLEGESMEQAEIKTLTQLGHPKLISTALKQMLQPQTLLRLYSRVLVVGVMTWPVTVVLNHMFSIIMNWLGPVLYQPQGESGFIAFPTWLPIFLMGSITISGLVILFRLTLYEVYCFYKTQPQSYHRLGLGASLCITQFLVTLYPLTTGSIELISLMPLLFFQTLAIITAYIIMFYFFHWQEQRLLLRWQSKDVNTMIQHRGHRLTTILASVVLVIIILTTIAPVLSPSPFVLVQYRSEIEISLLRIFPVFLHLLNGNEGTLQNMIFGYRLEAWLFVCLGLIAVSSIGRYIYQRYHKKDDVSFPWLSLTTMIYVITLLSYPPHYPLTIDWQVPHKNLNAVMEQEQLGLWYNFIYYAAQYDSLFNYGFKTEQTDLVLQTTSHYSYLLSAIQSVDNFQLTQTYLKKKNVGYDATPPPLGVRCNNATNCTELRWQDKIIFTNPTVPLSLLAQKITPDQNFALVMLGETNNTHYYVYLIDLR